ncbi:glutamate ABC transporter substrate-binding protein [Amycolatopsis taiwanensis]|uniref:ABC transporter substrate-binding protein n=1 Tax=Amycolatopsis taiwanensis TaxID=342230 RepID=A0A9W6RB53_9PSEU|nr:glutamate ABC transporter substrate-binding protein [Amycolatopsis taiwanensis]GLY70735.1 ABC transporter substrate-binding protein [Amycolatopsis taiwanensis]
MRRVTGTARVLGLFAAVAFFAAACGSSRTPVDPASIGNVQAPLPASVNTAPPPANGQAATDCDTRSLAPSSAIPAGSTMAEIKQRGRLIAGVDSSTFLFGFLDPAKGDFEGFDIDIVKQIANALFGDWRDHVQWKAIPSSSREDMLTSGQVDIVVRTYSITCDRLQKVNFSSTYYVAGQRVLVQKSKGFRGLADLRDKKVCSAQDSTSLTNLAKAPERPIPVSVRNWADCLVMLQQGQVDAVSTDDTILAGMARQDPNLEVVGPRLTEEDYGVGIPKGHEDMVRYVNYVLDNVRNGNAWRQSYSAWLSELGSASPPSVTYR